VERPGRGNLSTRYFITVALPLVFPTSSALRPAFFGHATFWQNLCGRIQSRIAVLHPHS
jgi:hypothetical protein